MVKQYQGIRYTTPVEEFDFLLHSGALPLQELLRLRYFKESDYDSAVLLGALEDVGTRARKLLLPHNRTSDTVGATYDKGKKSVAVAPGHKEAFDQTFDIPAVTSDPEFGGLGMPKFVGMGIAEMLSSTDMSFSLYHGLTIDAIEAMESYASDEQKNKFLRKLISGKWTGTMNLTESHAGIDLGNLRTKAVPVEGRDGEYAVSGQKIFISCGEHNLTENIVHLVLARLPGAKEGVKGLSLFIVPKNKVDESGELLRDEKGEPVRNGVEAIGIEEKMGIHGSPTCTLSYEKATGYLIGQPGQGLDVMFKVMNAARLGVGMQALGVAEIAYQTAVAYAHGRASGGKPIVHYPNIVAMLMTMRSRTNGMRALAWHTAMCLDMEKHHPDVESHDRACARVALMTPIIKALTTDWGADAARMTMDVFGGQGYMAHQGVEQFARDVAITRIYEGSNNSAQAFDLAGRKVLRDHGKDLQMVVADMRAELAAGRADKELSEIAKPMRQVLNAFSRLTDTLAFKVDGDISELAAPAEPYMRAFGMLAVGEMHLRMARAAQNILAKGAESDELRRLCEGKIAEARFYIKRTMPEAAAEIEKAKVPLRDIMVIAADDLTRRDMGASNAFSMQPPLERGRPSHLDKLQLPGPGLGRKGLAGQALMAASVIGEAEGLNGKRDAVKALREAMKKRTTNAARRKASAG